MTTETVLQLDPTAVQVDENLRFSLKETAIDSLAESILSEGRVLEPVGVEPLAPPVNGFTHRLVWGFYRHAAVTALNKTQNAGLSLPAVEVSPADALARAKTQIAENNARENMSPMDRAVAAKRLMDLGTSRQEVRRIFSSPGGRKGAPQPLSNAMLNIMLRWLELPKTIQQKIHVGLVGVAAAYELSRVPAEKRAAVLEAAEKERLRVIEKEEADEERYLKAEQKLAEAQKEHTETLTEVEQVKNQLVEGEKLLAEKTQDLRTVQKMPYLELDDAGKKQMTEKLKAAEADVKGAEKALKSIKNDLARSLKKQNLAQETAAEVAAKLEVARKVVKASKGGAGKKKEVGAADVKRAAAAVGVSGAVPLALSDIRSGIKDIASCKEYPKAAAVGAAIKAWLDGKDTPKETCDAIAVLTGEREAPIPAPAPATVPAKAMAKK